MMLPADAAVMNFRLANILALLVGATGGRIADFLWVMKVKNMG
jgi:hypothetical protein